ncbi:hypothetical protein D3C72_2090650 [compost metagenome]
MGHQHAQDEQQRRADGVAVAVVALAGLLGLYVGHHLARAQQNAQQGFGQQDQPDQCLVHKVFK